MNKEIKKVYFIKVNNFDVDKHPLTLHRQTEDQEIQGGFTIIFNFCYCYTSCAHVRLPFNVCNDLTLK